MKQRCVEGRRVQSPARLSFFESIPETVQKYTGQVDDVFILTVVVLSKEKLSYPVVQLRILLESVLAGR